MVSVMTSEMKGSIMESTADSVSPDLAEVLSALDLSGNEELFQEGWAEAQAEFEADKLPFMDHDFESAMCAYMRMSPEVTDAVLASRAMFERTPALQRLGWYCLWVMLRADKEHVPPLGKWPDIPTHVAPMVSMFYVHILVCAVPRVQVLHGLRGIDEEVTRDTLADPEIWVLDHKEKTGEWGITERQWLRGHYVGQTIQLGRLQFRPEVFPYDLHLWRNRTTDEVRTLAGDQARFRRDGQHDGVNDIADPAAWTARYSADDAAVSGFPIAPSGCAIRTEVTLDCSKWREVLQKGDPILGIHIPASGSLSHAACRQAYRLAMEFFPTHYPELEFKAFTCSSWLMDNQLSDHLSEASNIVLFQRDYFLTPIPGTNDFQTLERVFGAPPKDINTAPQETSLQRMVIQHMQDGRRWRQACGIILPDEVAKGEWDYRNQGA
jgi:GNAT-like C-terminal domain/N-acyltransferase N-terminal domain